MKKAAIYLFILLFLPAITFANPGDGAAFINGKVTDKDTHQTLAGVEVHVKGTNITTYSDFDGNFFISDLPAGSYELEFHFITYDETSVVTSKTTGQQSITVEMQQR
ncbi:MAG TPA: carboxypeptidase-like regulatory domain-containing protein [Bacteroidia bacterium]|nr:carboxypeptidase-like regulatory domain-containing protein [Bacteroidia bacterium]